MPSRCSWRDQSSAGGRLPCALRTKARRRSLCSRDLEERVQTLKEGGGTTSIPPQADDRGVFAGEHASPVELPPVVYRPAIRRTLGPAVAVALSAVAASHRARRRV